MNAAMPVTQMILSLWKHAHFITMESRGQPINVQDTSDTIWVRSAEVPGSTSCVSIMNTLLVTVCSFSTRGSTPRLGPVDMKFVDKMDIIHTFLMDETDQTVTPPPWSVPINGLLLLDILFLEKKMYLRVSTDLSHGSLSFIRMFKS